jgi:hypothetical protein
MSRTIRRISLAIIVWCGAMFAPQPASACQDGYYNQCALRFCVCVPNLGTVFPPATEAAGVALAIAIQQSRDSSLGTSQPIPRAIRDQLAGYVDEGTLANTTFKVGDSGVLNVAGLTVQYGDVSAITLLDVVVFTNEWDVYNNPKLWAHELKHVQQFREWGVRSFGIRYARNHGAVETAAREYADGYVDWRDRGSPPPPPTSICWTGLGECAVPGVQPALTPCSCTFPGGASANGFTKR